MESLPYEDRLATLTKNFDRDRASIDTLHDALRSAHTLFGDSLEELCNLELEQAIKYFRTLQPHQAMLLPISADIYVPGRDAPVSFDFEPEDWNENAASKHKDLVFTKVVVYASYKTIKNGLVFRKQDKCITQYGSELLTHITEYIVFSTKFLDFVWSHVPHVDYSCFDALLVSIKSEDDHR